MSSSPTQFYFCVTCKYPHTHRSKAHAVPHEKVGAAARLAPFLPHPFPPARHSPLPVSCVRSVRASWLRHSGGTLSTVHTLVFLHSSERTAWHIPPYSSFSFTITRTLSLPFQLCGTSQTLFHCSSRELALFVFRIALVFYSNKNVP